MSEHLSSAVESRHGSESDFTAPTTLIHSRACNKEALDKHTVSK
jgi:hypothetical protein